MKFGGLNTTEGVVNTNEAEIAEKCNLENDALMGVTDHKDVTGTAGWGASAIRGIFRANNGQLVASQTNIYKDGVALGTGGEFGSGADIAFAKVVDDVFIVGKGDTPQKYDGTTLADAGPVAAPVNGLGLQRINPIFNPRRFHTATAVGTKIIVVGGQYRSDIVESNSDGTSWGVAGYVDTQALGNIYAHAAVASGTDLYISGGRRSAGGIDYSDNVYKWDGTTLTKYTITSSFGPRASHSMWIHNIGGVDWLFVGGGRTTGGTILRTVYKALLSNPVSWSVAHTGTGVAGTFLDGIVNPGRGIFEFNSKPTAIIDKDNSFLLDNAEVSTAGDLKRLYITKEGGWDAGPLKAYVAGSEWRPPILNYYIGGDQFRVGYGTYGGALLVYDTISQQYRFKAMAGAKQTLATEALARDQAEKETINTDTEVRIAVVVIHNTQAVNDWYAPVDSTSSYSFHSFVNSGSGVTPTFYNYGPDFVSVGSNPGKTDLTANIFQSADDGGTWTSVSTNLENIYGTKRAGVTSGGILYLLLDGGSSIKGSRFFNTQAANDLSVFVDATDGQMNIPADADRLETMSSSADFTIFGTTFFITGKSVVMSDGTSTWAEILAGLTGEVNYWYSFINTSTLLESELSPAAVTNGTLVLNNQIVQVSGFNALPTGPYAYRLYRIGTSSSPDDLPQLVAQFTSTAAYNDTIRDVELGSSYDDKGGGENLPPPPLTDIIFHKQSQVLFGIDASGDLRYSKPYNAHENWPVTGNRVILAAKAVRLATYQGYIFAFSAAGVTVISGFYRKYNVKPIPGAPGIVVPTSPRLPQSISTGKGGIFYLADDGIYAITTNMATGVRITELESFVLGTYSDAAGGFNNDDFVLSYSNGTGGMVLAEDGAYTHNPIGTITLFYLDEGKLIYGTNAGKLYEWQGAGTYKLFNYKTVPADAKTTAPKEYRKVIIDGEGNFNVTPYINNVAKTTITFAPGDTIRQPFEQKFEYRGKRVALKITATSTTFRAKIYSISIDTHKMIAGSG